MRRAALPILLVLAILSIYWQTFSHPFINYDDDRYITDNLWVTKGLNWEGISWAFTTCHEANWHPITWLSHMIDVQLFGLDAGSHHMVNVVLHTTNILLLLLLLIRLTGRAGLSATVTILFALHPLRVESVAWVAERKDLLAALFCFLSLYAYAVYTKRPDRKIWASLFLFALGLMAKPMLVTLPILLLLLDWWPLARFERERCSHLLIEKIPFFVLAAGSCVMTIYAQRAGGAVVTLSTLGFPLRVANAIGSYGGYLRKTFWPIDLAILYPHPQQVEWWKFGIGLTLLIICSVVAVLAARREPAITVGWFWFVGTLVPVIGLVQVGQQGMADRYTYLPHVGLFIALTWGVYALVPSKLKQLKYGVVLMLVVSLFLAIGTWHQTAYWRDPEILYKHTLELTKDNFVIHENLAFVLENRGKLEEALVHRDKAADIRPWQADTIFMRATTLYALARYREAVVGYQSALRIRSDYPQAHNNLGAALHKLGNTSDAIIHFQQALTINPLDMNARQNLKILKKEPAEATK